MIEDHNYMLGNTIASIKFTFGTKVGFVLVRSSLLPFGSSFWSKCSGTTRRNATEKNELGGYVTVPCLSKLTQHKSTADWLSF